MSVPVFLETDPAVLVPELVAQVEAALGKALYPAQLERLLIDVVAYREALLRRGIQEAAEQCLVEYARGAALEGLGALVGVTRLPAAKATVTWRLSIPVAEGSPHVFAAGWGAVGMGQAFRLKAQATIPAGQLSVEAEAEAETAGAAGIDLPLNTAWSPLVGAEAVESITLSSAGADAETDAQLRARILDAPSRWSAAGSAGAYRYHALAAHPDILEVHVQGGAPGTVEVYPLCRDGLPSQAVLDAVEAALTADAVRPICDLVVVAAPAQVTYAIVADLTLYATADAAAVMAAAQTAAEAYAADRRAGLGRDLVGSQVIAALSVPGVYSVALSGWSDQVLGGHQWADASAITLSQAGVAHG